MPAILPRDSISRLRCCNIQQRCCQALQVPIELMCELGSILQPKNPCRSNKDVGFLRKWLLKCCEPSLNQIRNNCLSNSLIQEGWHPNLRAPDNSKNESNRKYLSSLQKHPNISRIRGFAEALFFFGGCFWGPRWAPRQVRLPWDHCHAISPKLDTYQLPQLTGHQRSIENWPTDFQKTMLHYASVLASKMKSLTGCKLWMTPRWSFSS